MVIGFQIHYPYHCFFNTNLIKVIFETRFFCSVFIGKNNISAACWIKKSKFELVPPHKKNIRIFFRLFFSSVSLLIIKNATTWTKTNSEIVRILILPEFIVENVVLIKSLFQKRFPIKISKIIIIKFRPRVGWTAPEI